VQEQDGRSIPRSGLKIEDLGIANVGVTIVGHATSFYSFYSSKRGGSSSGYTASDVLTDKMIHYRC